MALTRPTQISTDPIVNNNALAAINASFDQIEQAPRWRYAADFGFQNTYVDVATGTNRARFWKQADGVVYMAGQVKRPLGPIGVSEIIFPLPVGYQVRNSVNFIVSASTVPVAIAELQIDTAVRMLSCQGAAPFIVWLNGISYPAEK